MKLFTKVHCKGYLKKTSDGVYIRILNRFGNIPQSRNDWHTASGYKNDTFLKDLSSWDGDSVEKEYRKRVECSFNGFLVGFTRVNYKGIIGTDTDIYGERRFVFKDITDKPKVAVVFFKNNCKRYVLLDDLEEYEDFKPDSNKECPMEGQVTFEDIDV